MQTRYRDMGDGTHARVLDIGNRQDRVVGITSAMPHLFDIVRGIYTEEGKEHFQTFGHNADVGTTLETVYQGSDRYTYLSSAEQLSIVSDSANDTAAGSGARSVKITGLDANWDPLTETVDLNGTTPVNTTNSFLRVNTIEVATAGSGRTNDGEILAQNNAEDNTLAYIEPGEGESHNGLYSIPAGKTGYVVQWHGFEQSNQESEIYLAITLEGEVTKLRRGALLASDQFHMSLQLPLVLPPKTDIELLARTVSGGGDVMAGFEGWYE